jgi:hypothetical protein
MAVFLLPVQVKKQLNLQLQQVSKAGPFQPSQNPNKNLPKLHNWLTRSN